MDSDRKRVKPFVIESSKSNDRLFFWCIANIQSYVDGGDDCFVKEVPISEGSEYMTYEADHFIDEATLYDSKEMAERLIVCYHMPERVYKPIMVLMYTNYIVDPEREFTEEPQYT